MWVGAPVARRAMFLELGDLLHAAGLDDRPGDAIPVSPPAAPPGGPAGAPAVTVLGYRPQFNASAALVRRRGHRPARHVLAVRAPGRRPLPAEPIAGCHLSAPVRCDFVQVTPERTATVGRTDGRHVRVVVSGPVGARKHQSIGLGVGRWETLPGFAQRICAHRTVVARLQRRDPAIPTDLGWQTVHAAADPGHGRTAHEAAWVGVLEPRPRSPSCAPAPTPTGG